MPPVKSQSKANPTKKEEEVKKGNQKNVRRSGSKASLPPSKVPNGKQKGRGNVHNLEDENAGDVKSDRRSKAEKGKKRGTEQKPPQKQTGIRLRNGKTANGRSQPQPEKDNKSIVGINKTTKPKPPKEPTTKQGRIHKKYPTKPENKRSDKVTESEEEESESDTGSSVEVTEEETSNDEKEEERGSSEEPTETQGSEESGKEEAEVSDTPGDTEQTADEKSDKELAEEAKSSSDSEVEAITSSEEEVEKQKEVEVSEAVISDGDEDKEITQEDTPNKPRTNRACRRHRQTPQPPKPAQEPKYKMFKKTKEEKQAEKAEKQRAKAEKQRLEKEAKQKAKEEKKNKKKQQKEEKTNSATEEIQAPKDKSHVPQSTNKKNINETDASVEEDPDEEEEEEEPTLTKAIKGQNKVMLLKAKGKDLKTILDPEAAKEGQQEAGSVIKGRPQSLLLGKVKMASLRHKANKTLVKPDEETSESEVVDVGSSKAKERLIARRKGVTTLRRVSGWIQKKMPRGLNLRKKVSAWTKAIGVSRWLSLRAIKQKKGPRKSKGNFLKHRMAMTVTSKTGLGGRTTKTSSEVKMAKEKTGDGGGESAPAGEKEVEAKYAVVLPRMNKLGKAKTTQEPQAAPGPSTPSSTTESPGEHATSEPKPPKPGARLVLPVKPDLSLLKSIKKPLPGGITSGGDVAERSPGPSVGTAAVEGSSNTEDTNRRPALDNKNGVSVLQAAKGKLGPSKINLTKMSLSGGVMGATPTRAKGPDPEGEAVAGIPRSSTQPLSNGEASTVPPGVRSVYEEEADREVAQLMGEGAIYTIAQPEVHWAGNPRMSGNPQVCVTFLVNLLFLIDW